MYTRRCTMKIYNVDAGALCLCRPMFSSGRQRKRKIRLRKRDTSAEEDSSSGEDEDSSDGDESMRSPEARAQAEAGTSRRPTAQAAGKTRRIRRRRVVAWASATPLPPLPCIAPDGHQTPRRRPARAPGWCTSTTSQVSELVRATLESLLLPRLREMRDGEM